MKKRQKRAVSGLILAGTSLISIVGQTATNVSAGGSIFGSIKNFFTKTKNEVPLKLQKEKIIEVSEIGISRRGALNVFFVSIAFFTAAIASIIASSKSLIAYSSLPLAALCSAAYFALVSEYEKSKARRALTNLKGKIREDMLNKQYTLKEFKEIVKDDEKCSEFVRQLLVLEMEPDVDDEEGYKLIDNGELEEATETLKKLFIEIDSVDKINDLKKLPQQDKEKLLKVVEPLLTWACGKMPALFGKEDCFCYQEDDEFTSKVGLLCNALCYTQSTADEPKTAISCLSANGFVNFICRDDNSFEEKPYTKEYAKRSFVYYTKKYLAEHYSSDVFFSDSQLLNSAKSLFKNLKNFDLLDFNENEKDNCSSSSELAAKEFQNKFPIYKKLGNDVFAAIERYLKEHVEGYDVKKYTNREGGEESLKERIKYVKEYLSSQQEKDSSH